MELIKELEKKLWQAADKLRNGLDAAEYKHVVLGLIFLKYISDAFNEHRALLRSHFENPKHDSYLGKKVAEEDILAKLEDRDYYIAKNVFWVPSKARWETLQAQAKQPRIGKIIDDAMDSIEKENPKLKGILNKDYARLRLSSGKLGELIDLIGTIGFKDNEHKAKDILGHVYEYFLGQFASAEGKKGGQFYTPKSIVTLIVELLEPYKGRVYDPAMGSGGFFISSEKFIEEHVGRIGGISIYGQESNPTTWRLAAMNLALRGIDFNFGHEPADTFLRDLHKDLRADFIMANPPFNTKDWGGQQLAEDKRWQFGIPPNNNANYAWMQHMIHHLAPNGSAGIVLANGSMSSNTANEGVIRKNIIDADLLECMIALPGQLFTNTQIPACIWVLSKAKKPFCDRQGKVLFIDAREVGTMVSRVQRSFSTEDIKQVADCFHNWRKGENYKDIPGFCKSVNVDEIKKHDYVLTPGRYVDMAEAFEETETFAEKMNELTSQLKSQFAESKKLESAIRKNLRGLGYDV